MNSLRYAVVTPVRDEEDNLTRLAESLLMQHRKPVEWVIAETGSDDGTPRVAAELALQHPWIHVVQAPGPAARGGPIVRAFQAGVDALTSLYDVVVKLDADVSVEADYFEELLRCFEHDPRLGIASGSCWELDDGRWRQRHVTAAHVWGASRAYRAECLRMVRPLEERMGWDGIDAFKANAHGWKTQTFVEVGFRHHRAEASRERGRWQVWWARGEHIHYMAYRPSFVLLRAVFHSARDVRALAMVVGWLAAALRRQPQNPAIDARAVVRRQQRLRELPLRAREALGRRPVPPTARE